MLCSRNNDNNTTVSCIKAALPPLADFTKLTQVQADEKECG